MLKELPTELVQIGSLFPLPETPSYEQLMPITGRGRWQENILHRTPMKPTLRNNK
jgi:hypothetical protein